MYHKHVIWLRNTSYIPQTNPRTQTFCQKPTNNTTNAKGINLLSQENQDYYNQHNQQFIARKHDGGQGYYNLRDQQLITREYDGGLEQVTIELVPDIILEEEEDGFYQ